MLVIRTEQMRALGWPRLREWIDGELNRHWPSYASLEPSARHALLEQGRARAAAHGLVEGRDICLFTTLMLHLGREFDRDPNLPWVSEILHGRAWSSPAEKLFVLYAAAADRLEATRHV
jgi:hypothetical protein